MENFKVIKIERKKDYGLVIETNQGDIVVKVGLKPNGRILVTVEYSNELNIYRVDGEGKPENKQGNV